MIRVRICLLFSAITIMVSAEMNCYYGERGSLTATCINAVSSYFRESPYRFDYLDEYLNCVNCTLTSLSPGTFDLNGNRIKVLNISNSKIEKVNSKAFVGLVFLDSLIMNNNPISTIHPDSLFGIRKLKLLDLTNCSLTSLEEYMFQETKLLKEIYLSGNKLTTLKPNVFNRLVNLEVLDLSFNELTYIGESLTQLTSLTVLLLNNNKLPRIESADFQHLSNLLELNLANNALNNITMSGPSSLRNLDLSNNFLSNLTLTDLEGVETLNLASNAIHEVRPKLFQGLHGLRRLDLSVNSIAGLKTGAFSALPSLSILNVSNNEVETIEITGRLKMYNLNLLDLSHNRIIDFDHEWFHKKAPHVIEIDLRDNPLPCQYKTASKYYFKDNDVILDVNLTGCPEISVEQRIEFLREHHVKETMVHSKANAFRVVQVLLIVFIVVLVAILYFIHFYVVKTNH